MACAQLKRLSLDAAWAGRRLRATAIEHSPSCPKVSAMRLADFFSGFVRARFFRRLCQGVSVGREFAFLRRPSI